MMVMMMVKSDFKYEIVEHLATLKETNDGRFTVEVNLISFNGAEPKIDIRKWNRENGTMLKGISLTEEEANELLSALTEYFR